jgi:hypothetical protein
MPKVLKKKKDGGGRGGLPILVVVVGGGAWRFLGESAALGGPDVLERGVEPVFRRVAAGFVRG